MISLKELMTKHDAFTGLTMGNYALARAMAEAGLKVATSYPGSPTPEIGAALLSVPPAERPYYFEFSTNEKVAIEIAAGASMNGHLSACFFKSVGLNVAADSLIQLSMMELIGGMVVILGDDPGANSSQNEQDNRHFARMSYIPMLEPASPREAREMFLEAASISRRLRMPVFLRLTTHVCHARERVDFGPLPAGGEGWESKFDPKNGPYVPVAATVFPLKEKALRKQDEFGRLMDVSAMNRLFPAASGPARLGIVSAGLPALCAVEAVAAAGAPVDVLKLGSTWPLPSEKLCDFMGSHEEVFVLEDLDRVLETGIKALAFDRGLKCRIHSRREAADLMGEMTPPRAAAMLAAAWPGHFKAPPPRPSSEEPAARMPQLCPGCGHRSAFHAVKRALPAGAITVADIGCHSMGFLPPYEMGTVLLSMGHSVSTGAGLALGNSSRKVVSFLGDSTFFHAAMPGIVNAVVQDSDITLVLLENGTTAMTGHQPRAGSGEIGDKIPLPRLLEAMGVKFVRDVEAYKQAELAAALKEAMDHKGFAVVIARHPCMLKFMREAKHKNPALKSSRVAVDQSKCARHYTCVADFACPSFVRHGDGSVTVHPELCIGDGSCVQTCPAAAIVREKPGEGK